MCMNNASESHEENKLRKSTKSKNVHFIDWQEEIDWLIAMIDTRRDWLIAMIDTIEVVVNNIFYLW